MKYNDNFEKFKFSHKIDDPATKDVVGFDEHFHSIYELLLFLEGDVDYVIENRKYRLKPYDLLFIQPGEHHYINILSKRKYDRMVFRFPEDIIPSELVTILKNKPNLFKIAQTNILEIFRKFDDYYPMLDSYKQMIIFQAMIVEILVLLSEVEGFEHNQPSIIDPLIEKVLNYIHENLFEDIVIDELCEMFFVSKSHLYKTFTDTMKVPIAEYIRSKRVLHEHHLILNGHKPTEVFIDCGFTDYSTFYRSYTKIMGYSPSTKVR